MSVNAEPTKPHISVRGMVGSHVAGIQSDMLTVGDGDKDAEHGVAVEQEDVLAVRCGCGPDVLNLVPERQEMVIKEDYEAGSCIYASVHGLVS